MKLSRQIKPISYLKSNAAEVLSRLEADRGVLIITQNGEAKAVLQDVKTFEDTQEALSLLKILALGNEQIRKKTVIPVNKAIKDIRKRHKK